ncbi:4-hydroxybenzoyl-CoA reductase subunit beta [Anatilimnocola aggregata]|uniref:4-hydroxybenzoyl-CoA reductase subunit beta n=1 Tax=Anatilimnocola aggregata TaxID=2528021 RepID=A0A517YGK2_9BACT|nr:FAD binding domain-containing protein [Anatilimnocola aggregata]QDU29331.1 4-hydroxybenzoyl-CoA reductase subunit beta [Anatilimnocola aggregata]
MKNFEYASPRTEAEVLSLLSSQAGHTEILAGGTDLIGLMQAQIVRPERVVNILEVPSLKTIEQLDNGVLAVGAVVTLDVLLDHPYLTPYPALKQAIEGIASMQLQCQGTLGGEVLQRPQCWFFRQGRGLLAGGGKLAAEGDNRFHAIFGNHGAAKFVSNSRLAPALVALNAQVRVIGPGEADEKLMSAEQLYRAPRHEAEREHTLLPNQLVTHLLIPASTGFNATYEVRHGAGPDYPLASAAVSLQIEGGIVQDARIVLGHVAPTPWLSLDAAAELVGKPVTEETAAAAGAAAVVAASPLSNNEYKVQLTKIAVKRAILRAAGLETGGL